MKIKGKSNIKRGKDQIWSHFFFRKTNREEKKIEEEKRKRKKKEKPRKVRNFVWKVWNLYGIL